MMLLLFDKLKLFISILLLAGFMTIATIAYDEEIPMEWARINR